MTQIINITKLFPENAKNISNQLLTAFGGLILYPSWSLFVRPPMIFMTPMCVMTHMCSVHNNLKYIASELKNPEYKYMKFSIYNGLMYSFELKPELTAELTNKRSFISYKINNPYIVSASISSMNKYFNANPTTTINRYHLNDKYKNNLENIMKVRQQRFRHILSTTIVCSFFTTVGITMMHVNIYASSLSSLAMFIGGTIGAVTVPNNNFLNHYNFQKDILKLSDIIEDKYINLYNFDKQHYWYYIDTLGNIKYIKYSEKKPTTFRNKFYI